MDEMQQFKCLTDLREMISQLHGYYARPVPRGDHPTTYPNRDDGPYKTIMGIRVCDYKLSPDGQWALPDDQMGLSFSATWQRHSNHRFLAPENFESSLKIGVKDLFNVTGIKPTFSSPSHRP